MKGESKTPEVLVFSICNFVFYVPYTMLTKLYAMGAVSLGLGISPSAFELLPVFAIGQSVALFSFIYVSGWWRYARAIRILGVRIPRPRSFTLLSGICTIGQIVTALLAYSFEGVSIVFAALLMKGGTLALAPLADTFSRKRRKIFWPSFVASSLSLLALVIALWDGSGFAITLVCVVDIAFYLLSYLSKLMIMSSFSKTGDAKDKRAYIAEEETVIALGLFILFALFGAVGSMMSGDGILVRIWYGWKEVPFSANCWLPFLIGVATSMCGIFSMLVFLDYRENTFCVAANQSSSLIAGTAASMLLAFFFGAPPPTANKYMGALVLVAAIFFLQKRTCFIVKKNEHNEAGSICVDT